MTHNHPEILAPVGNPDKLRAALHFGADAVYLGLKQGSLRAYAGNFTLDELEWALGYAHERQRRIYVCVNTQPFDDDLPALATLLRDLGHLGPDGLIVADPGVVTLARQHAPAVPLHLSTQASVTNAAAARFWSDQGLRRIVLARELSLERLAQLSRDVPPACELEVFAHGAVCVAYSGRCFLSTYWSGRPSRDPRRGACAQGCRWQYSRMAVEDRRRPGQWNPLEQDERGTYFFDAKDLCALPVLDRLLDTGVRALKLEGRTRSMHYVGVVTDVYRHATDRLAQGDQAGFQRTLPAYLRELHRPTNRGFSTHFLTGEQDDPSSYNPVGSYDGTRRDEFVGEVVAADADGLWLRCRNGVRPGEPLEARDRGLVREAFTLERVELRDGTASQDPARPNDVIRIPALVHIGVGALVRRQVAQSAEAT